MQTAITRTSDPGRVLLVDDHPAVRRVLRSLLEEVGGWQVVGEADSGEAAVDMVEQLVPDVVLMDCRMPGAGAVTGPVMEDLRELYEAAVNRTKELEAENADLSSTVARLEEVDRLKDEFLAMVSHELRTPITVVLGMAQTLGRPKGGNVPAVHGQVAVEPVEDPDAPAPATVRFAGLGVVGSAAPPTPPTTWSRQDRSIPSIPMVRPIPAWLR